MRRRILYLSSLSCLDSYSGAALCAFHTLKALSDSGHICSAFFPGKVLANIDLDYEEIISGYAGGFSSAEISFLGTKLSVFKSKSGPVAFNVLKTKSTSLESFENHEILYLIEESKRLVAEFAPDYIFATRADPIDDILIGIGLSLGRRVILRIPALNQTFMNVGRNRVVCTTPSRFADLFCRAKIGVATEIIPCAFDWGTVRPTRHEPCFVTFVNPIKEKGLAVFLAIAHELNAARPDIKFLAVEGRGDRIDENLLTPNISVMPHTADPRKFWSKSRICLMPSICNETFGRVAAEALINGIPVVGSHRGAIPEVVGDAGEILPLPDDMLRKNRSVLDRETLARWTESVVRLWDDADHYNRISKVAVKRSFRWKPESIADGYRELFLKCEL